MKVVNLYSDGACKGNPGNGGWGNVLSTVLRNGNLYEKEYSCGYRKTTNNRMELLGVIEGLKKITNGCCVIVTTDSKYVCNAITLGWLAGWRETQYKKGKVANSDLWEELWTQMGRMTNVIFEWVEGHHGHPYNERCDSLASNAALQTAGLQIDAGYESGKYRGKK